MKVTWRNIFGVYMSIEKAAKTAIYEPIDLICFVQYILYQLTYPNYHTRLSGNISDGR